MPCVPACPASCNLTRDVARSALHAAGFSAEHPSFRAEDTPDGAVVIVLLEGPALDERTTLAADVLGDRFRVSGAGARLLVKPQILRVRRGAP